MLVRALDRNAPLGLIVMAAVVVLVLVKIFYPLNVDDVPWYACGSMAQPFFAAFGLLVSLAAVRSMANAFGLTSGNVLTTVQAATYLVLIDQKCSLYPLIGLTIFSVVCGFLLTTYGVDGVGRIVFHLGMAVGVLAIFNHWAIVLTVWLLLSLLILRAFRINEIALTALGFGLPYTVWLTVVMFTQPNLVQAWAGLGNLSPELGAFALKKQHLAFTVFLLLGGAGALMASATGPVRQRNYILVLLAALVVCSMLVLLMGLHAQWPLAMLLMPASIILARMIQGAGNTWLSDALLIVFLVITLVPF